MAETIVQPKKDSEHVTPIDGELRAFLEALDLLAIDIMPKTA
jgi:hypothetical protein